jgi:hypothetical protein
VGRFQWVEGFDDLYPREHGPYLSRPLPTDTALAIPDHATPPGKKLVQYLTPQEMVQSLRRLHETYPELVRLTEVGRSWQGRRIMAVEMGNRAAGPLSERPAMYVDGQHHAREAISAQVVLYFLWYLASEYGHDPLVTRVLDTRTVYAIPSVNPDGNAIFLESDQRQRKTANPSASDDDWDNSFDEDGREKAGYGSYEVYNYEFTSDWVDAHQENPFVEEWWKHAVSSAFLGLFDESRQELVQIDDDGDGLQGEDPPGGVDPNRNYDSHWETGNNSPPSEIYQGPAPFSEPETVAVRDYVLARPNIVTASSFHSGTDLLLYPWGWSAEADLPDAYWYEMLSRKGSQLTEINGYKGTRHGWTARGGYPGSGSTMDWLYEQGILAWTPEVYGASGIGYVDPIGGTNSYVVGYNIGEGYNPSDSEVELVAGRWLNWNMYLLVATPNVALSGVRVKGKHLEITVANDGLLPLDVQVTAKSGRELHTTAMDGLSAGEQTWSVPLQSRHRTQRVTIVLKARSAVGIAPGPTQVERLRLTVEKNKVEVTAGRLEPFVELDQVFGGWFADPAVWDTPEYHLGPPLPAEAGGE